MFRCNAADLAGAAVRVHIALTSTSAAPTLTPHCTEEHSNSEDESTERAPDPSQQISESQGQNLDVRSSEITDGKRQEDDVGFLESTIAVSILVERAMHLSLKGKPPTRSFFFIVAVFICFNACFPECMFVVFVSWGLLITAPVRSNLQTEKQHLFLRPILTQ